MRGRFIWHELMTNNPDAAAVFYGKVIGWKTQGWPQDPSYRQWTSGGAPVAGLLALPNEAKLAGSPPFWMTYIGVADVDATVRQATGLGAKTHVGPRDLPGAGRFAVLADPQGAMFAVFTSSQREPEQLEMGGFSWHELATTDTQAAWRFYRTLFSWENTGSIDLGPHGVYLEFGCGAGPAGGIYNKPLEIPMPNWLPYIRVPRADDTGKAATRAGGRVINAPMEVPGGDRVVTFLDPQGAMIAAHSQRAPKPARKKPAKKKAKPKPTKRRR